MAAVLQRIVVDAGPVVSLLLDDEAAGEVAAVLGAADRIRISVVNVTEILDVLRRVHRTDAGAAADAMDRFLDEVAEPVAATRELAARAADVRARRYHHRDRDVSLADCFVIATALPDEAIATSDEAVARVARQEGIDVVALPNARGRRPSA